jgi:RNA polymerase sigma-70 factor (ECF subfamily)
MNSSTDIELMQQLRGGSEAALREIIERHRERLFRLAHRLLNDSDAASDAVQETFIRLWKHSRRYDPSKSLSTWLCTICARRCYDELRRRYRHFSLIIALPTEAVSPDDMAADELLSLLQQVVASLPPKQRTVYQLREIEGLSADEVAIATRMSADHVKANLYVARTAVREKLKRYGIQ